MDGANTEQFRGVTHSFIDNYQKVLTTYIPQELKNLSTQPRVLSVACGMGLELKGLAKTLPNAYIEAIDIENSSILGARGYNLDIPQDRIRLADATQKESFGSEDWDLIVVRNPRVGVAIDTKGTWAQIFQNCFDKLKPEGFLFLTTPSTYEMREVLKFFSELPVEDVTTNTINRDHTIQPPIVSRVPLTEDYIAVLKKLV